MQMLAVKRAFEQPDNVRVDVLVDGVLRGETVCPREETTLTECSSFDRE